MRRACTCRSEADFTPALGVDVFAENQLKTVGTLAEYGKSYPPESVGLDPKTLRCVATPEELYQGLDEGMRERGIKAANELSNSALRSAMLAVRQEGAHVDKPAAGVENAGPGLAPRPPRYTQAQKGGNNHVPGRSPIAAMRHPAAPPRPPAGGGGGGGEDAGGNAAARPRPPPEGSPSTSARHSRMGHGAPKWAGGVAMPPSQEQMGRMAQRAR